MIRRGLVLAVAMMALVPAAAAAKTIYASPDGVTTKGGCVQADPCDIVSAFGYAASGDTLILDQGMYEPAETLSDGGRDFTVQGSGAQGANAVKIYSSQVPAVSLQASTISDVQIDGTGTPGAAADPAVLQLVGSATAERVLAEQQSEDTTTPTAACSVFGSVKLLDSLCDGIGINWGLAVEGDSSATVTARNVTAIGTLAIYASDFVNGTTTLNASNLIADGSTDDIDADSVYGGSGGKIALNLSYSRYDTVSTPEYASTVTVTAAGTNGNITESPEFVSSTDFQEDPDSPTVHAGTTSGVPAGETDLDDNPRTVSGLIDMGAYQLQAAAPTASANAATAIGSSTATITGTIDPEGGDTTCAVEYTTDPEQPFDQSTPCLTADLGAGTASVSVQANLTELTPDTTYYYSVVGTNQVQSTASEVQSFTTLPQDPSVTESPASTTVAAGQTATFTAAASSVPAAVPVWQVSTDGGQNFSLTDVHTTTLSVTATLADNGYEYEASFENPADGATVTTAPATLTVTAPPAVTTSSAGNLSSGGAVLSGTVDPNGATVTTCAFRYGPHGQALTQSLPCAPADIGAGRAPVTVSADVAGLSASTSYDFELVATNGDGSVTSTPVGTFTTAAAASPPGGGTNPGGGTKPGGGTQPGGSAPSLRIEIARSTATVARSRAAIWISCNLRCSGSVALSRGRRTYVRSRFTLRGGRAASVEVKLPKALLKLLESARGHRLKLTVTVTDADSNPARVKRTVTFAESKAKRR